MVRIEVPYETAAEMGPTAGAEVAEENVHAEYDPEEPAPLDDLIGAVEAAVEDPIDSEPYSELIGEGVSVAIVTENEFRQAPSHEIAPYLVDRAEEAGADVSVVIANGKAPAPSDDEGRKNVVGESVVEKGIPISHNDVEDPDRYELVGITSAGIPLWVLEEVASADVVVTISTTQATLWGYGGSGMVIPGVAGNETIERNHITTLAPDCRPGNNDIKMQRDKYEALDIAGIDMGINTIVTNKKDTAYVNAGDPVTSHREAVAEYNRTYQYDISDLDEKPDIVVTGTTAPTDHLYFHSGWALVNCEPLVKEGGTIIHASPCPGYGDWPGFALMDLMEDYVPASAAGEEQALHDLLAGDKELWAGCIWYPIYRAMLKADVTVVTEDYNIEDAENVGFDATVSMEEAVADALAEHGDDATIATVPYGRYTVFDE
jgi:nickel-dependent lactate racemase